jgi:hypothetical protein
MEIWGSRLKVGRVLLLGLRPEGLGPVRHPPQCLNISHVTALRKGSKSSGRLGPTKRVAAMQVQAFLVAVENTSLYIE